MHSKKTDIQTTIANDTDEEKIYQVMMNIAKDVHKITLGQTQFEIPDTLAMNLVEFRKLSNHAIPFLLIYPKVLQAPKNPGPAVYADRKLILSVFPVPS